jgi:4-hydroxy-tetrahydrodipicolinate reductase
VTPPPIRVAVIGAAGRMGSTTCAAVDAADDLELVARIGRNDPLDLATGADVAVEFSTPATVHRNTAWLLDHGVHVVVGATGLAEEDLSDLRGRTTATAHCLVAANFAIGAVLLMQASEAIARHMPECEIVELHHDRKLDAPSGTAKRTAELVGAAGGNVHEPIHSVRLPGLVAHQEVIFGGEGQTLSLRHDSIDRVSFMPGVLLAVRRVAALPERFTVGLEKLL